MKKIIPVLLIMCLLCGLAACGSKAEDTAPVPAAPAEQEAPVEEAEAPAEQEAPAEEAETPAEQEEPAAQSTPEPADPEENDQLSRPDSGKAETDSGNNDSGNESGNSASAYELAQQYLGSDAGTFQSVVGAPNGSEYTISCEADGAEDGVWYYNDFVVWTVRYADGTEIVRDCDAY